MVSRLQAIPERLRVHFQSPVAKAEIVAFLILILLVPVWYYSIQWYEDQLLGEARAEARIQTSLRAHALSMAVNRRFARLEGLHAFVQAVAPTGDLESQFEPFAAGLYVGASGIRTLNVAPGGVIQYVYPLEGNEELFGYEPAQDPRPEARAAVQRTLVSGRVALYGANQLVQGGEGIIARQAVYINDAYWGLVNMVIDIQPVMDEAGMETEADGLLFSVRDKNGVILFGSENVYEQGPVASNVFLPEGAWEVAAVPVEGWAATIQYPLVVFQSSGFVMILLVVSLAYAMIGRQARLRMAVDAQTEEIRRINEQLRRDIQERVRIEGELRESERLYRTLAQNFPNGAVILYDHDLRYTIADGAGLAEVGLSSEMLVGKQLEELFPPDVATALEPAYRSALAGRTDVVEVEFADRCYEVRTHPLRDESGSVFSGMAMTQDITARKLAEDALRASETRLRALVDAIPDIMLRIRRDGTYLDFHAEKPEYLLLPPESLIGANMRDTSMSPELVELGLRAIDAAIETGEIQSLEYSLDMPDGVHYYEARHVASGEDEVFVTIRDITNRKLAERELARWAQIFEHAEWGVVVGSADGTTLETMNPAYARMHGYTVEELTHQPIPTVFAPESADDLRQLIRVADAEGHAVIESVHKRKDGTTFPVLVDLTTVRDVDGQVQYRVANVVDITERKRMEEALRQSQKSLAEAERIANLGAWEWDILKDEWTFSDQWMSIHATQDRHLTLAELLPLAHPEDAPAIERAFQMALDGRDAYDIEHRIVRKNDGQIRVLHSRGEVLRDAGGQPVKMYGAAQDITERKRAEEALQSSEARNRALLDAIPDLMFRINREGTYLDYHIHQASDVSVPLESIIGTNIRDTSQPPDLKEKFLHAIHAALDTGRMQILEYSIRLPDGLHYDEARVVASGSDEVVTIVRDVTERKRAEEALQESQQRYEELVNTIDSIVWEMDAITFQFSFVSQQAERLLGYPADEWVDSPTFWSDHIHPHDRDWVIRHCTQATAEKRAHELEYRMIAGDGRIVWLRDIVTVVVEDGKPALLRGVMVDITNRKLAEQQLREKEEQYRSIFEATSDALFINDLEGNLVDFNPAAAEMHGYTIEEFRGLQPPEFIHPDSLYLFEEYMETVRAGRVFRARAVDLRKDGTPFPIEVLGTAFTYRGEPHTLGVVRDISDQVRAFELLEQRVEERTRELSTLLEISRDVASTLELDPLMGLILDQLKIVVPYTAARIDTIEGDVLKVRASKGLPADAKLLQAEFSLDFPLLQEMIVHRRPVVVPDIRSRDPWAAALREESGDLFEEYFGHAGSWMGVPLTVRDRAIGVLALDHAEVGFFQPEQTGLVLAFANQVAVALENAHLYEEAKKLAVVEERNRLSRDLHDSVTQQLYSLTLFAEAARRSMLSGDSSPVEAYLSKLGETAQQSLKEMRLLVYQLRAPALVEQGLTGALHQRLDAVEKRAGVEVELTTEGNGVLTAAAEEELYWIAQEALNNVLKHAAASSVRLHIQLGGDGAALEIEDDGRGFEIETIRPGGMGLGSIRERVERLNGEVDIDSTPDQGTRVTVRLRESALKTLGGDSSPRIWPESQTAGG